MITMKNMMRVARLEAALGTDAMNGKPTKHRMLKMPRPTYAMADEPRRMSAPACKTYKPREIGMNNSPNPRARMTVCANCGGLPHGMALSEMERLQVLLAWEAGEVSEGVASKLLGVGRIEAREMRIAAVQDGLAVVERLRAAARSR
jgi:hypothetical protein